MSSVSLEIFLQFSLFVESFDIGAPSQALSVDEDPRDGLGAGDVPQDRLNFVPVLPFVQLDAGVFLVYLIEYLGISAD